MAVDLVMCLLAELPSYLWLYWVRVSASWPYFACLTAASSQSDNCDLAASGCTKQMYLSRSDSPALDLLLREAVSMASSCVHS